MDDFQAQATPETKLRLIRRMQSGGELVAMVGDGTNDAPALAQSDVAVCMNSGTPAAKAFGNVQLTPTTFVVDKNGKILKRYVGEPEWDALHKLLDGALASIALEEDGPPYVGTDIAALAWRLGPPGHPVARGIDILTIRDGRVSVVHTLIAT